MTTTNKVFGSDECEAKWPGLWWTMLAARSSFAGLVLY
jgi:hypothetical protein